MLTPEEMASILTEGRTAEQIRASGIGFDRVMEVPSTNTYRDQSTVLIMPNRVREFDFRVISAIFSMIAPMNQKRHMMYCIGDEVGVAYNNLIKAILDNPDLAKFKYLMTVEADNVVPADAHIRLLETIEAGQWDAVSGLYFTKGDVNMPMAYGDPARFEATGELEFTPRDVTEALTKGMVMPVNGIAMGCALWRLEMFKEIPGPWYITVNDVVGSGVMAFTQDLWFCKTARKAGRRFAVDCRVRVGHMDLETKEIY